MTDTPNTTEEARAKLKGITSGPWRTEWNSDEHGGVPVYSQSGPLAQCADCYTEAEFEPEDAEFIAAAPDLVRGLLSERAELLLSRAELADENEHLRNWRDGDRDRNELIQLRATLRQIREWAAEERDCHYTREVLRLLGAAS
ncbi:hypothetical protein PP512_gp59 [Gordonia phage Denise]|uniref:Ead/Ea22-like family protein n=1 Tax=Gordonia phage Denise TaxID=2652879 RepID=A0A5P8DCF0_9CAUD|nr:hypothetical protein PP512_gp59 [Gordonia phage Denise]QFP96674.1 hypothetical protein SEA_DENISE_59 [Gordonia phage Denise]